MPNPDRLTWDVTCRPDGQPNESDRRPEGWQPAFPIPADVAKARAESKSEARGRAMRATSDAMACILDSDAPAARAALRKALAALESAR